MYNLLIPINNLSPLFGEFHAKNILISKENNILFYTVPFIRVKL